MGSSTDGPLERTARTVLLRTPGLGACPRGIVGTSSSRRRNCLYCGLGRADSTLPGCRMPVEEMIPAMENGWRHGVCSLLLRSGELPGEARVGRVAEVLRRVEGRRGEEAGMAFSIGELPRRALAELRKAKARRSPPRIETSDKEFCNRIHPGDCLHESGAPPVSGRSRGDRPAGRHRAARRRDVADRREPRIRPPLPQGD